MKFAAKVFVIQNLCIYWIKGRESAKTVRVDVIVLSRGSWQRRFVLGGYEGRLLQEWVSVCVCVCVSS